ncbi:serine/threonine-protein kinase [Nocardia sp. SYP-A9097]|uniref:serine/threonine-protein kinase n=1 Tax=Nocardia sp. SYP-A9097 TaxID=2663237 RepID=UPI001890D42A|nr:serine/threonine-protein kinase [Nocardia sp. SYP-A9097]
MKPLMPQDPQWLGENRLLTVIGQGGMGRVFLGRTPTGRLVAVKQIHRHLAGDPEFRARFEREVQAGRMVTGAYTAPVIDSSADPENPWLATEYIAAPDLATVLEESGPLHLGGLRLLAAGLAAALVEIHRAGLVHRDLKPGNVLLTPQGPRLIDLGISRVEHADGQLTMTGQMIGSPGYTAPEQSEGRAVGPAADVFSLGAVLAFAATGSGPFPGTSTPQIMYAIAHSAPDITGVPPSLRGLVESCLAKDPAQRPTAEEVLTTAADITAEPVWPEPVCTRIAAHRADSDWWAETAEKQSKYQDQLADIRNHRRELLRWLAVAAVAVLVLAGVGTMASHWAAMSGHAEPMHDPSLALTAAELRTLDDCKLLDMTLPGKFGTRKSDPDRDSVVSCGLTLTDAANKSVTFKLEVGALLSETLIPAQNTGRTVGWTPIFGGDAFYSSCDRSVITQSGGQVALKLTVQGGSGDQCEVAESALVAVVRQLTVFVPLRRLALDSVLAVDPCAVLDLDAGRAIAGDPAKRDSQFPHECAISGDNTSVRLALAETSRPDSGSEKFQLGSYTVFRSSGDTSCSIAYMVRPTTGKMAEVANISVADRSGNIDTCARAQELMAAVIPKLPKA